MKWKAVTPKYVSRARLDGKGLGVCTKRRAAGCEPRNRSMGLGEGTSGPLAPAAFRNSKNSAPSRVGKPSVEWLTMSVCTWSARLNRIASPRGFASGELSGILGSPVELEKRTVTGVDSRVTWG